MAYMSEDGYKKLMAELKHLETVERPKYRLPLPKRVTKVICRKMQSMTLPRKLKVCLR